MSSVLPLGLQNLESLGPSPLQETCPPQTLVSESPHSQALPPHGRGGWGAGGHAWTLLFLCRFPQGHGGHPQGHRAGLQPCEGDVPQLLALPPWPLHPGLASPCRLRVPSPPLPCPLHPALPLTPKEGGKCDPMESQPKENWRVKGRIGAPSGELRQVPDSPRSSLQTKALGDSAHGPCTPGR